MVPDTICYRFQTFSKHLSATGENPLGYLESFQAPALPKKMG